MPPKESSAYDPDDSDSQYTSSSSSSSSSSVCSMDERMDALENVNELLAWMPDVEPLQEPTDPHHPDVVRIQYTKSFNHVMGLYRRMSPTFSAAPNPPSSPRWFLLLAFVLRHCAAHYTAWRDRRHVLCHATRLLSSTQESLPASAPPISALHWLPRRMELLAPNGTFSLWRAVGWELRNVRDFNLTFQKNFQVWHHRKELLLAALDATGEVLDSEENMDHYLSTQHGMRFADVDERIITETALSLDSKNYHVWLHRSWFVHAFSFCVRPPSWAALWNHYNEDANNSKGVGNETLSPKQEEACPSKTNPTHDNSESVSSRPFTDTASHMKEDDTSNVWRLDEDAKWLSICMRPTLPPCALREELHYTATLIRDDCLNNSAWCHRFYLFDRDLIGALLHNAPFATERLERLEDVVRRLCMAEVRYALQWCAYEPCNESTFVQARSVAAVYQAAVIRLHLAYNNNNNNDDHPNTHPAQGNTDKDSSPNKDVGCKQHEGVFKAGESLLNPSFRVRGFSSLAERVPWGVYLRSFDLFMQQLRVIEECIVPRAEALRRCAESADKATLLAMANQRSIFLLDSTHQPHAALYHGLFAFLEQTWCSYFTDTERERVGVVLSPEVYDEGIEAAKRRVFDERVKREHSECVAFFLECEVRAAELAARLVGEDSIRSKYWKHETKLILHRDYY